MKKGIVSLVAVSMLGTTGVAQANTTEKMSEIDHVSQFDRADRWSENYQPGITAKNQEQSVRSVETEANSEVLGSISSLFPDENLALVVAREMGKSVENEVTKADLESITYLSGFNKQIQDIKGVENLTNLRHLSLSSNQIKDIGPLENLTNLDGLNLRENQIEDISPLKNLINLTGLGLEYNQIKDGSPLASLTNLRSVSLHENQIKDISFLKGLTNLTHLLLVGNQIKDGSPLENLTKIYQLELGENQIKDISFLKGLTNLALLGLEGNQIKDLSPLENLTENFTVLRELDISRNQISDLRPLKKVPRYQFKASGQHIELGPGQVGVSTTLPLYNVNGTVPNISIEGGNYQDESLIWDKAGANSFTWTGQNNFSGTVVQTVK
ncbi:leucine-rich repeat domain-containing protein [Brevibacterium sp. JNUCC-42]|nr:leucine-rich repeat domain-containing protein [Brevibacterium sp. JNUCC-42]